MMTSYFNLLKYAQTGIASPDMTDFDKMRASTLMGGTVQTLTGQPPLTFNADGTPLISWSMKGNGSQQGTPTPDAPIMPEFVGVRTVNRTYQNDVTTANPTTLLGSSSALTQSLVALSPDTQYVLSWRFISESTSGVRNQIRLYSGATSLNVYIDNGVPFALTAEAISNLTTCIAYFGNAGGTMADFMLNIGDTALQYEPFGYKLPITCAEQTTPVYLGQVSTVRRIKKLVLDGTEAWTLQSINSYGIANLFTRLPANYGAKKVGLSSHFTIQDTLIADTKTEGFLITSQDVLYIRINDARASTSADFKSYLAAQYANATPVTVWYVLAEPQTAIVNEPLCKIGDYADELHSEDAGVSIPTTKGQNTLTVETDLQPSEMTITFKG